MDTRTKPQKAIDEIKEILERHDLAGMVMVVDRDSAAFMQKIDPTWSCAWMEEPVGDEPVQVKIRSKLADYGGDRDRQKAEIEATTGMFITFHGWLSNARENMSKITLLLAKHYPEILHSEKWTGGKW